MEAEDTPEREGDATGVMIHEGGTYRGEDGEMHTTGSLGCFTLAGKDASNEGVNRLVEDINSRKQANKSAGKGDNVDLKVEKRDDVDWSFYTDEDGSTETSDGW